MEISLEEIKAVKTFLDKRPELFDDQAAESIAKMLVYQGRHILAAANVENVLGLEPCKACGGFVIHSCKRETVDSRTQKINGSNKTAANLELSYNDTVDPQPLQGKKPVASIEQALAAVQARNPNVQIEIAKSETGKPVLVVVPKEIEIRRMQCHECKGTGYPWQMVSKDDGTICLHCLERPKIGGRA